MNVPISKFYLETLLINVLEITVAHFGIHLEASPDDGISVRIMNWKNISVHKCQ